jgi:hypothetical protein
MGYSFCDKEILQQKAWRNRWTSLVVQSSLNLKIGFQQASTNLF